MAAETQVPAGSGGRAAALLDTLCPMLIEAEAEFNALDRVIGDGDHGSNLARAARNLADLRDELVALAPGEALARAGRATVMSVGGASGPLYGTLLMEMGKSLPYSPRLADWAPARRRKAPCGECRLHPCPPRSRAGARRRARGYWPRMRRRPQRRQCRRQEWS